jgi:hypothetical protein
MYIKSQLSTNWNFLHTMTVIMKLLLVSFLSLVLCSLGRTREPTLAPTYVVNLDLPPEERWTQVTKDYVVYIKHIRAELRYM